MPQIHSLLDSLDASTSPRGLSRRQALPPAPAICSPLPEFATLEKTALHEARQAQRQHLLQEAVNSPLELPADAHPVPPADLAHANSTLAGAAGAKTPTPRSRGARDGPDSWEPYHVLRAIDHKDVMTLMEIKSSHRFDLLLQGNPLPIVYAMRLGKTHQDIAILLVGAMSRKVNDVTDDQLAMMDPATKSTLRALRASLKIAISHSLASLDTSLIASFLQVVIMSEGSRWLVASAHTLALAFRTGSQARPVATAQDMMLKWVSRELQRAQVSAVGDYTANGVGDLCLLGLWDVVVDQLGAASAEPLPLYYFGRDDRMLKAVEERIRSANARGQYSRVGKLIRNQLDVALDVLGQRRLNGRERIEKLALALDSPP
ncbi:hypothetical protein JCM11491_000963 [Sporobolomyces phaffii]